MSEETNVEAPPTTSPAQEQTDSTRPATADDDKPEESTAGAANDVSNGLSEQAEGSSQGTSCCVEVRTRLKLTSLRHSG